MSWNCRKIECPFADENNNCTYYNEEYGSTCCLNEKNYQFPFMREVFRKSRMDGIEDFICFINENGTNQEIACDDDLRDFLQEQFNYYKEQMND